VIVVITEAAEADLEQLGDAIAVDSPLRAISFVRELRGRCEGLAEFPRLKRNDKRFPGARARCRLSRAAPQRRHQILGHERNLSRQFEEASR
jgi:plasmid stabilization system protein ParE